MAHTQAASAQASAGAIGQAVIDCDAHVYPPKVEALFPYLSDHWREYIAQSAFKGAPENAYPPNIPLAARPEARLENGPPGSDLGLLRAQLLDALPVETAILTCLYAVESIHNPDAAAAIASAVNDWLLAEWLAVEPRLRAALVVPIQQPEMAAREIDRLGAHPGVVAVLLPVRSEALYGNRRYLPVFEAAARHDLVVNIHAGGMVGYPPTPSGWPSFYYEDVANMAQIFQSQLLNMIVEGLFDRFAGLRVSLLESGVTWLPGFIWRVDKEWKGLRREVPWNRMLPGEYIRRHVRLTLTPFDAPPTTEQVEQVIAEMGADDLLLFSSDYPHWHDDAPLGALPAGLPERLLPGILAANARAWYRL